MTEGLLILIWKKNMADVEKKRRRKRTKKTGICLSFSTLRLNRQTFRIAEIAISAREDEEV